jgi:hypothetical protein
VADNSMVNWLPTLAGMFYENTVNQIGISQQFDSDFNNKTINLEEVPFIWQHMKSKSNLFDFMLITFCFRKYNHTLE